MELIHTFSPHGDESGPGYYRRLSAANTLTGWKELARLCEVAVSKSALFTRPEHISRCLGLEATWSLHASAQDDIARGWRGLRRANSDAVCPQCLGESPHLRLGWEHAYMVACPRHEVLLCDACDACGARLTSSREHIAHCMCGHDLRLNKSIQATDAQLWVAALLASSGASSGRWTPTVADVHIDLVSQLVRALCLYADPRVLPRRQNTAPPKTVQESLEFLRPLEGLLAQWPLGFEAHVSERIAAGPPDARTLNVLLGPWYHHLRAFVEHESFQPFLEAVGRVAAVEFSGLLSLDTAAQVTTKNSGYMLLAQAAKRIGVSRDMLLTQVKSGDVAHRKKLFGTRGQVFEIPTHEVEDIVAARNGWLSEKAACDMLGVPPMVLRRMADVELLVHKIDWRTDLRKGGPVERSSVETLISKMFANSLVSCVPDGQKIALRELTSRRTGDKKAFSAVIRAMTDGDIHPLKKGERIGEFQYLLTDISKYFSTPLLEAGMSVHALSKATGWKFESISHWIDTGLLQSHSIVLRGQPCRVVMPAQLLEFSHTYVPLATVARELGSKSSAMYERMEGIEVVGSQLLSTGQRRGGLVRIGDLARLALAKQHAMRSSVELHNNHD